MSSRANPTKPPLWRFLSKNPFPGPWTTGFFFREKMRAIYKIAPNSGVRRVLEIGGGESGLSALLFPNATVINMDLDPRYANSFCNQQPSVRFVSGDAADLPFRNEVFDVVAMFDVLEHIPGHTAAIREALRVLRPGARLLITTPNERWRFPFYPIFRGICPAEADLMSEWGHVCRGYSLKQLETLTGLQPETRMDFINSATVLSHDLSFSRLPWKLRRIACALLGPVIWLAYALHRKRTRGTETASAWIKPVPTVEKPEAPLLKWAAAAK